jgi:pseudaminic acid synthase
VVKDIIKGEVFTEQNIKSIRPEFSLDPRYYSLLIGKKATIDYSKGDRLTQDVLND